MGSKIFNYGLVILLFIPSLSFAGQKIIGNLQVTGLSGSGTKCLQTDNSGNVSNFSGTCSGGSGTVTSVGLSSSNSTLTIGSTPVTTSGTITADINLSHANTWGALQTFGNNISLGGVTVTGSQGTGKVVFDNTPTITNLTVSSLTSGSWFSNSVLVTNGSSGVITSGRTGTLGSIVASGSPTITSPTVLTYLTLSAANLITDTTTGTKIGTATSQKLGFYNATPIVQPTGNVCTALQNLGLVASCTETNQWTTTGSDIYYNAGSVFIGATSALISGVPFEVKSDGSVTNSSSLFIDTQANGSGAGPTLKLISDDGVGMSSGSRLGSFGFTGAYDSSHTMPSMSSVLIYALASQNWTSTHLGADFVIGTTPNNSATRVEVARVTNSGHIESKGTAPTVSSCGTSPSIVSLSTDNSGSVQVGSVSATSCLVTFANTWTNAPNCVATDDTNIIAVRAVATTTTLTLSSTLLTGDVITWICQGNR